MKFENIQLTKSMYKNEKGFSACLEELDPSASYQNTPLAGLDAFERQLKRFDIKVKGAGSSSISKFFSTAEGAALFPEYVSRAVAQGAKESGILEEIIASKTMVDSMDYRSITTDLDCGTAINTPIAEGDDIPTTEILLSKKLVKLKKRGRMLQASYEAIKFQRIDVFSVALAQVGNYIAKAQLEDAVSVLLSGSPETVTAGGTLTYSDLLALWGKFADFEMNVLLAAPDMALEILSIAELKDPVLGLGFQNSGAMVTPMGATLLRSSAVPAGKVVALDKRFALEMACAGGIQVEHDKLINAQLERAAVTCISGFNKLFDGAVKVLSK